MRVYDIIFIFSIFLLSILSGYFMTPLFIKIFIDGKSVARNYRGEFVPQGIGIIFTLGCLIWYVLYLFTFDFLSTMTLLALFSFFAMSFVGFIDDMLGSRDVTGLKGHFKALLNGRLTTGAIKAIVGFLVAMVISTFFSVDIIDLLLNTLIIALFTNLLNLFDLRPGRAIKLYIFLILMFFVNSLFTGKFYTLMFFLPIIGFVLGYFPYDLNAKCMMGDAGSNLLGISVGMLTILQLAYMEKIIVLILLVIIHVFAEKYSISGVIAKNSVLNYIDNLGRDSKRDDKL